MTVQHPVDPDHPVAGVSGKVLAMKKKPGLARHRHDNP